MNGHSMRMPTDPPWTLDEYEEFLQSVPDGERWELVGGRLWKMMTGGTIAHNIIVSTIAAALRAALKAAGSPCRVFQENVRLVSRKADAAFFPDVFVACGPLDRSATTVDSADLVVEVHSRTSRDRDLGAKLDAYRTLTPLRHCILVEQTHPQVTVWTRSDAGVWTSTVLHGFDATLHLPAFALALPLSTLYEDALDGPSSQEA